MVLPVPPSAPSHNFPVQQYRQAQGGLGETSESEVKKRLAKAPRLPPSNVLFSVNMVGARSALQGVMRQGPCSSAHTVQAGATGLHQPLCWPVAT